LHAVGLQWANKDGCGFGQPVRQVEEFARRVDGCQGGAISAIMGQFQVSFSTSGSDQSITFDRQTLPQRMPATPRRAGILLDLRLPGLTAWKLSVVTDS
jgi:hypothetical protein